MLPRMLGVRLVNVLNRQGPPMADCPIASTSTNLEVCVGNPSREPPLKKKHRENGRFLERTMVEKNGEGIKP